MEKLFEILATDIEKFLSECDSLNDQSLDYEHPKANLDAIKSLDFSNETIQAKDIIDQFFPAIDSSITLFFSHSHKDQQLVTRFANFLYRFGIKSFIDSHYWGYIDDLNKILLDQHARDKANSNSSSNLQKTMRVLSNTQAILTSCLATIMDSTKGFILISSSNSAVNNGNTVYETVSPWVFQELHLANLLQKRSANLEQDNQSNLGYSAETLKINYATGNFKPTHVSLTNLEKINDELPQSIFDDLEFSDDNDELTQLLYSLKTGYLDLITMLLFYIWEGK